MPSGVRMLERVCEYHSVPYAFSSPLSTTRSLVGLSSDLHDLPLSPMSEALVLYLNQTSFSLRVQQAHCLSNNRDALFRFLLS